MRIETAADDAAGLTQAVLAEANIRSLRQSIRNLNDGLSLSQTLEGALGEINTNLQRLRELSVQASNATFQKNDRLALQDEVFQLIAEIDKISDNTKFNHVNLLDGTASNLQVFVDNGAEGTSSLQVDLLRVDTHNIVQKAAHTSESKGVDLNALADGDVIINDVKIRGTVDADDLLSTKNASGSAIAKAKAINAFSAQTGVTARAEKNVVTGTNAVQAQLLDEQSFFTINNVRIGGVDVQDNDRSGVLTDAINAVREETGVRAQITDQGQLQLIADDGRNIHLTYNSGQALAATGITSKSGGGAANFAGGLGFNGIVSKSSVQPGVGGAGDIDAGDLKGTIQLIGTETSLASYNVSNISVGGEFNRPQDYIDYVIEFVEGGGFGDAKFKIARDAASETTPVETYEFIQGSVNPLATEINTGGGDYFANANIHVSGTYTGAIDRTFTLNIVTAGPTDGDAPAEYTITDSGTGLTSSTVTTVAPSALQTIFTTPTGDVINVNFDPSVRTDTQSINPAVQGYSGNVTFTGSYTGGVSKTKTISITDAGYTQGTNSAVATLVETDVSGSVTPPTSFTVNGSGPIDIGDGLFINFPPQSPQITISAPTIQGSYDTSSVTVASNPDLYVEETPTTFKIEILSTGTTNVATAELTQDGTVLSSGFTLFGGTFSLGDNVSINFPGSPSSGAEAVGDTTFTTAASIGSNFYTGYNTVNIGGDYDGNLGTTGEGTLTFTVVKPGIVPASGTLGSAILEYTLNGVTLGSIAATAGTISVTNGIEINFATISGPTTTGAPSTYSQSISGNTITFLGGVANGGLWHEDIRVNITPENMPPELVGRDLDFRIGFLGQSQPPFVVTRNNVYIEFVDRGTGENIINPTSSSKFYFLDSVGGIIPGVLEHDGNVYFSIERDELNGGPLITQTGGASATLEVIPPDYNYFTAPNGSKFDFSDTITDEFSQGAVKITFISASTVQFTRTNPSTNATSTALYTMTTGADGFNVIEIGDALSDRQPPGTDPAVLAANGYTETGDRAIFNIFKNTGLDPDFDLRINASSIQAGQEFTLELSGPILRLDSQNTLALTDAEALLVGDTFSAELITGILNDGDVLEIDVTAPVLAVGSSFSATHTVERMEVGDAIEVVANSAFNDTVFTLGANNTLLDGIELDFAVDGTFAVGDRVALQARGYLGDFRVTGQYTDPDNPTTLEVKVKQTGDIDGGALLTVTRLDTGAIVADDVPAVSQLNEATGDGDIGLGVFMEFQKTLGASAAHRIYEGDTFYVDVTGLLNHTFGGKLTLESDKAIDLEYSDVTIDQELGRMLYVGAEADVNSILPNGSLKEGVLGINTEYSIAKLDLTTEENANFAIRVVDAALEVISAARSEAGAFQNRVTHELANMSEALFQTERYQSRIQDADMAFEAARSARAQIVQGAGVQVLRQANQVGALSLQLLQGLLG